MATANQIKTKVKGQSPAKFSMFMVFDVFYVHNIAGGHGRVWDFAENAGLQEISAQIYGNGGIVSSVCHGAVGLLNIKVADGTHLIDGKQVTGFTNEEEKLAQLDQYMPYLTERALIERGAKFQQAAEPFAPFAIADGRLVTGQNLASSRDVAKLVLQQLQ